MASIPPWFPSAIQITILPPLFAVTSMFFIHPPEVEHQRYDPTDSVTIRRRKGRCPESCVLIWTTEGHCESPVSG